MITCNNCKYFSEIKNTAETGMGICTLTSYYQPTDLSRERCMYIYDYKLCRNCDHFDNDFACMTAEADDKACYMFESRVAVDFISYLYSVKLNEGQKAVDREIQFVLDELDELDIPEEKEKYTQLSLFDSQEEQNE